MTVTYTGNLKLGLPTTGTESGTWGDVVNNQITTLVDQSISGTVSLTSMTNADYTLTNGNGNAANEARYMALLVPSTLTLTANRNMIVPGTSKMYIVKNATTGGFSVVVKTSAGTGIEVPNGNTMLLYCDGTNVIVAFDTMNTVSQNGGQLAGLRNRIMNGKMDIAQRGTSFVGISSGQYTLDRFAAGVSGGGAVTVTQQADAPSSNEFQYSLRYAVTTADTSIAAGDFGRVHQAIEGYNVRDLIGKTFTLSFWVRSAKTGIHCVGFVNNGADRSYVMEYSVSAANTWEKKSVTVSGGLITAGTWDWTNNIGVQVNWCTVAGTTYQTTANAWQTGNFFATANQVNCLDTIGNIFAITGVQLELGSVATTFEQRPIGLELALCQRYYQPAPLARYAGYVSVTQNVITSVTYPPMRVAPTVTATYSQTNTTGAALGNIGVSGATFSANVTTGGSFDFSVSSGSSLSAEL